MSCKNNIKPLENLVKPFFDSTLTYKEIYIKIDSQTLSFEYYNSFDYYDKNGELLFYGYNQKTHFIDIINLSERKIEKHIKLEEQGPDAVGMRITGLNVVSPDSILIDDDSRLIFLNNNGSVFWKLMKSDPDLFKSIPKGDLLTRQEAFEPGYIKRNKNLYLIYQPFDRKLISKTPIILEINTDSLKTSLLPVYYSSAIVEKNSYRPIYGGPQACFCEDKIVVNFAYESNIYVYDFETRQVTPFGGKSMFTSNQSPPYDKNTNPDDYRITTITFHPVVYDQYRKYYYRTHWGEMALKRTESEYNTWPDKPVYLTVFNRDFNVVFEKKLEIENGIVPSHLFPGREGIFVFPWKQDLENLKNDQIKGIIVNFKSVK